MTTSQIDEAREARLARHREANRRYRLSHPDKVRAVERLYRLRNLVAVNEAHRRYAETHREQVRAANRRWAAAHKDKIQAWNAKQNARLREKRKTAKAAAMAAVVYSGDGIDVIHPAHFSRATLRLIIKKSGKT